MDKPSRRQARILSGCFLAYTTAYLARTNLPPALDAIAQTFSLSGAQTGLIASLFAVPYACGQLLNGALADRLRSGRLIFVGLVGSAAANFAFSRAQTYPFLLACWFVNGCFQSMVWTPMLRVLSVEFEGKQRDNALFFMSVTLVLGYLAAWLLSGLLTQRAGWRFAFGIAAALALLLTGVSALLLGDARGGSRAQTPEKRPAGERAPLLPLVFRTPLWLLLVCGVVNGWVRDGVMTWAPKLLSETASIRLSANVAVTLIVPLVSLAGILLGKRVYVCLGRRVENSLSALFLAAALASLALSRCYAGNAVLCAALLGLCSAMCYGANPLLTSLVPMRYQSLGRVATVAGLMDAAIYVGSALTGVVSGLVHDRLGWGAVFISWALLDAAGTLLLWRARRAK